MYFYQCSSFFDMGKYYVLWRAVVIVRTIALEKKCFAQFTLSYALYEYACYWCCFGLFLPNVSHFNGVKQHCANTKYLQVLSTTSLSLSSILDFFSFSACIIYFSWILTKLCNKMNRTNSNWVDSIHIKHNNYGRKKNEKKIIRRKRWHNSKIQTQTPNIK